MHNKIALRFLLFISPVIIPLSLFLYLDPFNLFSLPSTETPIGGRSIDFYATCNLIRNNESIKYNSFVFGSSRTLAYRMSDWQKYLSNEDIPFRFSASSENLFGIYKKFKFLKRKQIPIKNALITLSPTIFNKKEIYQKEIITCIRHPEISGDSWISFYLKYFKAFLNPKFFIALIDFKISGQQKNYMNKYLQFRPIRHDNLTNDIFLNDYDSLIKSDSVKYYYETRKALFDEFSDTTLRTYPPYISNEDSLMLTEIKNILSENNTSYKVLIHPLFNKRVMYFKDLKILENIFGRNNLYDFSGVNQFTLNRGYYYEQSHYRPLLGKIILDTLYIDGGLVD